ncbi:alpha/beta hydrolase-fold protein [Croceitalea sp. MTPC5]|uniref:alpha/beta hydrolase-fold protein n=1 Tax=Croceitalea sp. MTPC5 TaxID=3056565 RepID=UPI0030CEAC8B
MATRITMMVLTIILSTTTTFSQYDSLRIKSSILNRSVDVFLYQNGDPTENRSITYITDGKKMIQNGVIKRITELTKKNEIPHGFFAFVSTIDQQSSKDFRDEYFFCNSDYVRFFEEELLPQVESSIDNTFTSENRNLLGVSYGGMNAAYFSTQTDSIKNFAMLSPYIGPCGTLSNKILTSNQKDFRLFISSGINDAEEYVNILNEAYSTKTDKIKLYQTSGGHDFDNWIDQIGVALNFLSHKE